jgi:hypothetical protein
LGKVCKKPESITAAGVTQSERINTGRKLISGQKEKELFLSYHIVLLAVKII